MDNRIKNFLAIAISAGIFLFGAGYLSYVNYYSKSIEPSSFRSFSVSAAGKATAIPDIAQFTFSVITQGGKDIAALQKENTEKTNAAIAFLKEKGVDQKDIKTQTYNLEPRYQTFSCPAPILGEVPRVCPPPEIVGYTITQVAAVKIRDFSQIGDIVSGVVLNGANTVSQLSFSIDDPTALQNQARDEAVAEAKEKARLTAKAAGFKLGRLLSLDEGLSPVPFLGIGGEFKASLPTPSPAPVIEPGSQEITVTVTLRYEID